MRIGSTLLAFALGIGAGSSVATAGPLVISNVGGSVVEGWFDDVPDVSISNVAGSGIDRIRWGTPVSGSQQSGYDFDPVDGSITPTLGTAFLLGTFTHINAAVTGTVLESVRYSLTFSTNGNPAALTDTFDFAHDETPNQLGTCAPGSVSTCDDYVQVSSVLLNQQIIVGADTYFFNLVGFSTNGGGTISDLFQSPEGGANRAGLYAVVTETPAPVPEPASLLLMGTGALALARRLRRRREQ